MFYVHVPPARKQVTCLCNASGLRLRTGGDANPDQSVSPGEAHQSTPDVQLRSGLDDSLQAGSKDAHEGGKPLWVPSGHGALQCDVQMRSLPFTEDINGCCLIRRWSNASGLSLHANEKLGLLL